MLKNYVTRPGLRTSEFLAALANLVGQVVMALNGTVSNGTAVKYTLAGAIAYIISRGLAKYEPRTTVATDPPIPAAAPIGSAPAPAPPVQGG